MANEATPYFDPADVTTCYCEAAVTGKRFVAITGPRVDGLVQISPAPAGGAAGYGVALRDAAIEGKVGVAHVGVWPVKVGAAALTAGDKVTSDASGQAVVAAAGNQVLGIVVDDAAAGDDAPVRLANIPTVL